MRRIALVGTAESGVDAPYADPSYEIWGVSARAAYVTRADRWFELHRLDGEPRQWADNWRKTVKTFSEDLELVMLYPEPDLGPNVTQYPAERIAERFGTYFMSSTFSWMMAMAIDEMCPLGGNWKPGEIALFGVDMEYDTEYRQQRNGLRHFIDLARVMGITITRLANGGMSYEPVPYPLWQDDPLNAKLALRSEIIQQKLANMEVGMNNTRTMIIEGEAKLAEIALCKKKGYSTKKRKEELESELAALRHVSATTTADIIRAEGAEEEQSWLRDFLGT